MCHLQVSLTLIIAQFSKNDPEILAFWLIGFYYLYVEQKMLFSLHNRMKSMKSQRKRFIVDLFPLPE